VSDRLFGSGPPPHPSSSRIRTRRSGLEWLFMLQHGAGILTDQHIQRDIVGLSIAVAILFAAVAALALWLVRSKLKERILLLFGLFSVVYGARELFKNSLVRLAYGVSQNTRDYLVSWGDFLILIPFALFFEEIFGRGWRSSLRWATWIFSAYAFVGISLGLATGKPYYLREPAGTILFPLASIVFLLNVAMKYRPPQFPDKRIFLVGLGIFGAFALDEHFLPERYHAEPVGFLAFICSLGTIAVRRTIRNETKLLSVEQELAAARRIQASILPGEEPRVSGLRVAARYSPMSSVAGDFYDFALIDSTHIGLLVADVAGHGVPAALIASMVKVAFASQHPNFRDPGLVLHGLNQIFCSQLRGQYVTAGYLLIDSGSRSAVYSGAGHPPLIIWRAASQTTERYENNGLFLGFRTNESYPNLEIPLSPGDRLILYTDGLVEAMNFAEESFSDRLDAQIAAYRNLPAPSFADALLADVHAWTARSGSQRQDDDLTLVVVDVSVVPVDFDSTAPLQTALA
jgi:phosphoserine phosphatase RsbU/P